MSYPKEKRLKAGKSRWGEGKVHRLLYSRVNKMWYPACRAPGAYIHGIEVDPATPPTCKKC